MFFSSIEFLLYFLPIFMILYYYAPEAAKNAVLLGGSLVFYALGDAKYIMLLLVSVTVNYLIGLFLSPRRRERKLTAGKRKALLAAAILGNVGLLALFKFRSDELGFPLGISFYTFQIMSYLIDVYRGEIIRESSFLKLAVYVCMFPRMTSGPIVNYSEVSEHLEERRCTSREIQEGLKVFIMGLSAKVLLSDRIGLLWNEVQTVGFESISTPLAWIGALAYSMKLYFDFYGYSLMAVGLGKMMGFTLPENFEEPYMAQGVRDFYRRWHITLTRWFRNYVYIPLGGNRKGEARTICNLLVVWILTSLWHGTTFNFLVWGMSLWALIVLERLIGRLLPEKLWQVISRPYIWFVIPITWVCFAITDLGQLRIYLGRMFGLVEGINVFRLDWRNALSTYGGVLVVCLIACTPLIRLLFKKLKNHLAGMLLLGILFWICVWRIIVAGGNTFMYANF